MQQLEQGETGIITFSQMCHSAGPTPWHWVFRWRWREKPLQLSEQKQLQGLRVLCRAQPLHWAAAILAKSSFFFSSTAELTQRVSDTLVINETSSTFPNCSTHVPSELLLIRLPGVQVPPFCNHPGCPRSPSPFLQPLIKLHLSLSKNLPYLLCHYHFFTGTSPLKALHMHGDTFSPTATSSKLSTSTWNLQPKVSTPLCTSPASQAGRTKEIIQRDRRRMKIVFLISFTANLQYVFHITYF